MIPRKRPSDTFHFGAGVYNAFAAAAEAHLAGEGRSAPPPVPRFRDSGIIRVRNQTTAVDRFAILGIDDVAITPTANADEFKAKPVVDGVVSDIDLHRGKYVIALQPLDNGDIGLAVVSGLAVCQVNMLDGAHRWAEMADGDPERLVSAATGSARILWAESGTGTKWALVRLGPDVHHVEYGKPASHFDTGTYITLNPCQADGTDLAGVPSVNVHLSVRQDGFECPYDTDDILAFVRYDDPVACDTQGTPSMMIDGVLTGHPNGDWSNPYELENTGGSEETPSTDDWDRSDQGNYRGAILAVVTRVVYDETGDKVLYYMTREVTIDSIGKIAYIDVEVRNTADVPTDCTEG